MPLERIPLLVVVVAVIGLTILVVYGSVGIYWICVAYGRRKRAIAGRPITTFTDWCHKHYSDLEEDDWRHIEVVLQVFADEIGVHPTQLEPGDSLLRDYSFQGVASYFDDTYCVWTERLTEYIQATRGSKISETETHHLPVFLTLDDVIHETIALINMFPRGKVNNRSG